MKTYKRPLRDVFGIIMLFIILLFVEACKPYTETSSLSELVTLSNIDKIEILHTNDDFRDTTLRVANSSTEVKQIVNQFRKYRNDWQRYHPYALPGAITIEFYSGDVVQLTIQIGYRDNTKSGKTSYYLSIPFGRGRPLEKSDFKLLMETIGIDEYLANSDWKK